MYLLTHSVLLKALGWSLFNSFWQMSLLWAGYHLIVRIFSNLPARARHSLALLLLLAGTSWSLFTFITGYFTLAGPGETTPWLTGLIPATGLDGWVRYRHTLLDGLLPYASTAYLAILSILLIRYTRYYTQSRRILRTGLSKITPEFRVFVETTARKMGIHPSVKVHLSSLVDVPVTLGFLRPVILVPIAMLARLSTQQVEAILVHELAHIRRSDYLLNLLITGVEGLFFFNPFARMLISRLKKEREHCCDDQVLEFSYDPHAYVSALLSLARQHGQGKLAVAATGGGNDQFLLQRAKKILQQKPTSHRPGKRFFFLLFLGLIGLTLALPRPDTNDLSGQPGTPAPALIPINTTTSTELTRVIYLRKDTSIPSRSVAHTARRRTPHHIHLVNLNQDLVIQVLDDHAALPVINTAAHVSAPPPAFAEWKETPKHKKQLAENLPFVPNSSFSFQFIDTLSPDEKLSLMDQLAEKSMQAQVARLQSTVRSQLEVLAAQKATLNYVIAHRPDHPYPDQEEQRLRQLLEDQIKLQRNYLRDLNNLQSRLKTRPRTTTVYI